MVRHRKRGRSRRTRKQGVCEAMKCRLPQDDDIQDRKIWSIGCGKRWMLQNPRFVYRIIFYYSAKEVLENVM